MAEASPVSISLDLSKQSTQKPIIKNDLVRVRCAKISQGKNDNGDSIHFEWHLLDGAESTDGKELKPGFPVFDAIYLYSKNEPGVIPDMAKTKISKRMDALLGTGDEGNEKGRPTRPNSFIDAIPNMIAKEAWLKLKIKTGENASNEIVEVRSIADMSAA